MKKSAYPWAEKIRNIYFSIGVAISGSTSNWS
jgi:hypothetical protein